MTRDVARGRCLGFVNGGLRLALFSEITESDWRGSNDGLPMQRADENLVSWWRGRTRGIEFGRSLTTISGGFRPLGRSYQQITRTHPRAPQVSNRISMELLHRVKSRKTCSRRCHDRIDNGRMTFATMDSTSLSELE